MAGHRALPFTAAMTVMSESSSHSAMICIAAYASPSALPAASLWPRLASVASDSSQSSAAMTASTMLIEMVPFGALNGVGSLIVQSPQHAERQHFYRVRRHRWPEIGLVHQALLSPQPGQQRRIELVGVAMA